MTEIASCLARALSNIDWKNILFRIVRFYHQHAASVLLIRYLFQHRLESAADERRDVIFNSRVTFQLKRTLSGCAP